MTTILWTLHKTPKYSSNVFHGGGTRQGLTVHDHNQRSRNCHASDVTTMYKTILWQALPHTLAIPKLNNPSDNTSHGTVSETMKWNLSHTAESQPWEMPWVDLIGPHKNNKQNNKQNKKQNKTKNKTKQKTKQNQKQTKPKTKRKLKAQQKNQHWLNLSQLSK